MVTVTGGSGIPGVAVSINQLPAGIVLQARRPTEASFYWLVREARFVLWGFNSGPASTTATWQELCVHTAYDAVP